MEQKMLTGVGDFGNFCSKLLETGPGTPGTGPNELYQSQYKSSLSRTSKWSTNHRHVGRLRETLVSVVYSRMGKFIAYCHEVDERVSHAV